MSREHGNPSSGCTQAPCEPAALPGTGWRPDLFVGPQRPQDTGLCGVHRSSGPRSLVPGGLWDPCALPAQRAEGSIAFPDQFAVCGEAPRCHRPRAVGFGVWERLPASPRCRPAFLN